MVVKTQDGDRVVNVSAAREVRIVASKGRQKTYSVVAVFEPTHIVTLWESDDVTRAQSVLTDIWQGMTGERV